MKKYTGTEFLWGSVLERDVLEDVGDDGGGHAR
jgi:hypothetical protein